MQQEFKDLKSGAKCSVKERYLIPYKYSRGS